MKVQEALKAAIRELEILGATSSDAYAKCKSALSELEKCEPVALVALNNSALQKRVEVLEDLLTSAASIASRNGEGTHWERFIGQLKVNGIGNITAKTFRVLPSDEGYTSPISKEWVGLDSRFVDEIYNDYVVHENTTFEDFINRVSEKLKQLNAEKG